MNKNITTKLKQHTYQKIKYIINKKKVFKKI